SPFVAGLHPVARPDVVRPHVFDQARGDLLGAHLTPVGEVDFVLGPVVGVEAVAAQLGFEVVDAVSDRGGAGVACVVGFGGFGALLPVAGLLGEFDRLVELGGGAFPTSLVRVVGVVAGKEWLPEGAVASAVPPGRRVGAVLGCGA